MHAFSGWLMFIVALALVFGMQRILIAVRPADEAGIVVLSVQGALRCEAMLAVRLLIAGACMAATSGYLSTPGDWSKDRRARRSWNSRVGSATGRKFQPSRSILPS